MRSTTNLVFHHDQPVTNEVTYAITNAPKVTNTWEGWQKPATTNIP